MDIQLKAKPLVYRQYGAWFCSKWRNAAGWGVGSTPQEAYISWQRGGWLNYDTHLSKG